MNETTKKLICIYIYTQSTILISYKEKQQDLFI